MLSGLIAAILILSFSFSSTFTNHRAYATNYLVSDQASCEGLQVSGDRPFGDHSAQLIIIAKSAGSLRLIQATHLT